MLYDTSGRPTTSLRISVTRRCNLRCFYCHREGDGGTPQPEMTPPEITQLVEVAASLGVRKVKITGGEPLLREDLCEIISGIRGVVGVGEISMTTNGVYLAENAHRLKAAGLDRVNVSLPTLDPERYQFITGAPLLDKVRAGLEAAYRARLTPVKVNMVALRSVNGGEVWDMVDYSSKFDAVLQLIELENVSLPREMYERYYQSLEGVEREVEERAEEVTVRELHNRKVYQLRGGVGRVELVRPFHRSEFCMNCTRMRVTAEGELKPCLMREDNLLDLVAVIRRGESAEGLRELFGEAVKRREPFFSAPRVAERAVCISG